jgi:hypothetical protein
MPGIKGSYKRHLALVILLGLLIALSVDVKPGHSQTKEPEAQYTSLVNQGDTPKLYRLLTAFLPCMRSPSVSIIEWSRYGRAILRSYTMKKASTMMPRLSTSDRWQSLKKPSLPIIRMLLK